MLVLPPAAIFLLNGTMDKGELPCEPLWNWYVVALIELCGISVALAQVLEDDARINHLCDSVVRTAIEVRSHTLSTLQFASFADLSIEESVHLVGMRSEAIR